MAKLSNTILTCLVVMTALMFLFSTGLVAGWNSTTFTAYNSTCFQETANVATDCGGLSTGSYTSEGSWESAVSGMYDGSTASGSRATSGQMANLSVTYMKPAGSIAATWRYYLNGAAYANVTIPTSCWNYNSTALFVKWQSDRVAGTANYLYCLNSSGYSIIGNFGVPFFYEESMFWNITSTGSSSETVTLTTGLDSVKYISVPNTTTSIASAYLNVSSYGYLGPTWLIPGAKIPEAGFETVTTWSGGTQTNNVSYVTEGTYAYTIGIGTSNNQESYITKNMNLSGIGALRLDISGTGGPFPPAYDFVRVNGIQVGDYSYADTRPWSNNGSLQTVTIGRHNIGGGSYCFTPCVLGYDNMTYKNVTYATNPKIRINESLQVYYYPGTFYQQNNKTSNFASMLNSYFSTCNFVNGYCLIPLAFHTDSASSIDYSSLQFSGYEFISRYNNTYSNITFSTPINSSADINSVITSSANYIAINSTLYPEFNVSATVTLKNVPTTFAAPTILRDGAPCSPSICVNSTSLNAGNVTFTVPSWSSYSIGELTTLKTGLIRYYGLNEPTGNAVENLNGVYNLTNGAGIVRIQGKYGNAYNFTTAADSYSTGPQTGMPLGASARTVNFWLYDYANPADFAVALFYGDNTGTGTTWRERFKTSPSFSLSGNGADVDNLATVSNGAWHMMTMMYNGTTLTYYQDGVFVSNNVVTLNTDAGNACFMLGGENFNCESSKTTVWAGKLDEIGIWNRTLTSTEVTQLYNSGNGVVYTNGNFVDAGSTPVIVPTYPAQSAWAKRKLISGLNTSLSYNTLVIPYISGMATNFGDVRFTTNGLNTQFSNSSVNSTHDWGRYNDYGTWDNQTDSINNGLITANATIVGGYRIWYYTNKVNGTSPSTTFITHGISPYQYGVNVTWSFTDGTIASAVTAYYTDSTVRTLTVSNPSPTKNVTRIQYQLIGANADVGYMANISFQMINGLNISSIPLNQIQYRLVSYNSTDGIFVVNNNNAGSVYMYYNGPTTTTTSNASLPYLPSSYYTNLMSYWSFSETSGTTAADNYDGKNMTISVPALPSTTLSLTEADAITAANSELGFAFTPLRNIVLTSATVCSANSQPTSLILRNSSKDVIATSSISSYTGTFSTNLIAGQKYYMEANHSYGGVVTVCVNKSRPWGVYAGIINITNSSNKGVDGNNGNYFIYSVNGLGYGDQIRGPGIIGNGLVFNGNNSYAQNTAITDPLNKSFSISLWAKPNSMIADHRIIEKGQNNDWHMLTSISYIYFEAGTGGGNVGAPVVADGNWTHVVVTYNGTRTSFYKNGVLAATNDSMKYSDLSDTITIANYGGDKTYSFNGTLDEIGIWNRSLTSDEISQLYNNGLATTYIPISNPGPVTYGNAETTNSTFILPNATTTPTIVNSTVQYTTTIIPGIVYQWKFNEATNATFYDTLGTLNITTLTGNVVPGKINNSYAIDSSNRGNFSLGKTPLQVGTTGGMTVTFWYKRTADNLGIGTYPTIVGTGGSANNWGLYQNQDSPGTGIFMNGGNCPQIATTANNTWIYVTAMWNFTAGTCTLYKDGVLVGTSADPNNNTFGGYNVTFFTNPAISSSYARNAVFDDLRIYNKILNVSEINSIYNSGTGTESLSQTQRVVNFTANVSNDAGLSNATLTINQILAGTCYQETANVSTACGGLNTGVYSVAGLFNSLAYDGNYSTYSSLNSVSDIYYVNYTKPAGVQLTGNVIQWKNQNGFRNDTIPVACMNQSKLQLKIAYETWNGGCFPDGQVTMADGTTKDISQVKLGDYVLSWNESTNTNVVNKVYYVENITTDYIMHINNLDVTPNHWLWVNGKFMQAVNVKVGDTIVGLNGENILVNSVTYETTKEQIPVYAIEVENTHTYYVNGIRVHNGGGGGGQIGTQALDIGILLRCYDGSSYSEISRSVNNGGAVLLYDEGIFWNLGNATSVQVSQTTVDLSGLFTTVVSVPVSLMDGLYNWFWSVLGFNNNVATTTPLNQMDLEATYPTISFSGNTPVQGANYSNNPIYFFIDVTNGANLTLNVWSLANISYAYPLYENYINYNSVTTNGVGAGQSMLQPILIGTNTSTSGNITLTSLGLYMHTTELIGNLDVIIYNSTGTNNKDTALFNGTIPLSSISYGGVSDPSYWYNISMKNMTSQTQLIQGKRYVIWVNASQASSFGVRVADRDGNGYPVDGVYCPAPGFPNVYCNDANRQMLFQLFGNLTVVPFSNSTTIVPVVGTNYLTMAVPSDGYYSFNASASNPIGLTNWTETRNILVDTIAPNGTVISPVNNQTSPYAVWAGLVDYWNFDNNFTSLRNINSDFNNGATIGTGKVGNGSLKLPSGAYIRYPRNNFGSGSPQFSYSFWMNRTTMNVGGIDWWTTTSISNQQPELLFYPRSNLLNNYVYDSNDNHGFSSTGDVWADSKWHYITVTADGTTWRMYVDGVLNSTDTSSVYLDANTYYLFLGVTNTGSTIDGGIDEFSIWNRTLSSSEVSQLYNNGTGMTYSLPTTNGSTIRTNISIINFTANASDNIGLQSVTLNINNSAWFNNNWSYRKQINIGTPVPANYSLLVYVNKTSSMNSDYSDLRFTNSSGSLLPYWVENYTNVNASVWVMVQDNRPILMYYGNPTATSLSNITTAFLFGDDFSGTTLDTSKWGLLGSKPYTVSNGTLNLSAPDSWGNSIYSLQSWYTAGTQLVFKSKRDMSIAWPNERIGFANSTSYGTDNGYRADIYLSANVGGDANLEDGGSGVWFYPNQVSGTWYRWTLWNNGLYINGTESYSGNSAQYSYSKSRYDKIVFEGSRPDVADTVIDYIFVRTYIGNEPTVTVGTEQPGVLTQTYAPGTTTGVFSTAIFVVDGVYSWFFSILDWAGNLFQTDTNTLYVDTVAPTVSISSPITGYNYSTNQRTMTATINESSGTLLQFSNGMTTLTLANNTWYDSNYLSSNPFVSYGSIPTGAAAYYKLDETTGSTAFDIYGRYNGTKSGTGITLGTSGKINNSWFFNGTIGSSSLSLPFAIHSSPATFSAWVYWIGASGGANQWILMSDNGGYDFGLWVRQTTGEVLPNVGGYQPSTGYILQKNIWTHLVVEVNQSYARLFANGVPVWSGAGGLSDNGDSYTYYIGNHANGASQFDGKIDEAGFWNRSLSDSEVTDLYNYGLTQSSLNTFNIYNLTSVNNSQNTWTLSVTDMAGTVASANTTFLVDVNAPNITVLSPNNITQQVGWVANPVTFNDSNLRVYYKFNDNVGSTTALDSSRNSLNGTNVIDAVYGTPGIINNSLKLTTVYSSNDFAVTMPTITTGTTFTVSFWINKGNTLGNTGGNAYSLDFRNGGNVFAIDTEGSFTNFGDLSFYDGAWHNVGGGNIGYNAWHNVVMVFDGANSTATTYVDGAPFGSVQAYSGKPLVNGGIGGIRAGINATYDEYAIWNRTLSASEVANLYTNVGNPILIQNTSYYSNPNVTFIVNVTDYITNLATLKSGLKYYYTFDDTLNDSISGNNLTNFTSANNYQFVSGGVAGTKRINLTDTGLVSMSNSEITGSSPRTLSFWSKINEISTYKVMAQLGYQSANNAFTAAENSNLWMLQGNFAGNDYTFGSANTNWNHHVITYNGTTALWYINGVLTGTYVHTYATTNNPISINHNLYSPSPNLNNMTIDELGIWNRSLSSSEVALLYNSGTGLYYQNNKFVDPNTGSSGLANATITISNTTGIVNQTTYNLGGLTVATISMPISLLDGLYNWFWSIFDFAGNQATTQNYTTTIDTVNPGISFVSPPTYSNGANVSTHTIPVAVNINEVNINTVTFNVWGTNFNSVTTGGTPNWWNSLWPYKKDINVTALSNSGLGNYTILVNVNYSSNMRSDFGDLRFVNSNNVSLPYWFKDDSVNTGSSAEVYVKIGNLANQTISMYYGNPSATSESNIYNTFYFADSFDGNSLNASKWTQSGGILTISGGYAYFQYNGGNPQLRATSLVNTGTGGWESMAKWKWAQDDTGNYAALMYAGQSNGGTPLIYTGTIGDDGQRRVYGGYSSAWERLPRSTDWSTGFFIVGAGGNSTTRWHYDYNGTLVATSTNQIAPVFYPIIQMTGTGAAANISWFWTRPVANIEPTVAIGAQQTYYSKSISVANDGVYYYNVTVTDLVGHINSTETRTLTLDTYTPNVTIVSPIRNNWTNALTSGLTAYYNFENRSGSIPGTNSLNNLEGAPAFNTTNCLIGKCGQLSANNNFVLNKSSAVNFTLSNYSFNFWARGIDNGPSGNPYIIGSPTLSITQLGWDSPTNVAGMGWTTSNFYNLGSSTGYNTWFMITVTRNGNNVTVYQNGVPKYSSTPGANTYTDLYIGTIANLLYDWNGQVDEMGFWNRTLTSTEVSQLYNGGTGISYTTPSQLQTVLTNNSVTNFTININDTFMTSVSSNITFRDSLGNSTNNLGDPGNNGIGGGYFVAAYRFNATDTYVLKTIYFDVAMINSGGLTNLNAAIYPANATDGFSNFTQIGSNSSTIAVGSTGIFNVTFANNDTLIQNGTHYWVVFSTSDAFPRFVRLTSSANTGINGIGRGAGNLAGLPSSVSFGGTNGNDFYIQLYGQTINNYVQSSGLSTATLYVNANASSTFTPALVNGLAAYWKFDNPTGDVPDIVTGRYNWTLDGTVGNTTGVINQSRGRTGPSGAFQSNWTTMAAGTTDFTIEWWQNMASALNSGTYIQSSQDNVWPTPYKGLVFVSELGGGPTFCHLSLKNSTWVPGPQTASYYATTSVNIANTGNWANYALVKNSSGITLYVNGVYACTAQLNGNVYDMFNTVYRIGNEGTWGDGKFSDSLYDEMGVWTRALSQSEVIQLYNNGAGRTYVNNGYGGYAYSTTVDLGGLVTTVVSVPVSLIDGIYNWFWRIFDFAGNNVQTDANNTLLVDATPPSISFISPPTYSSGAIVPTHSIPVVLNITEVNLVSTTFNVWNSTWINSTTVQGLPINDNTLIWNNIPVVPNLVSGAENLPRGEKITMNKDTCIVGVTIAPGLSATKLWIYDNSNNLLKSSDIVGGVANTSLSVSAGQTYKVLVNSTVGITMRYITGANYPQAATDFNWVGAVYGTFTDDPTTYSNIMNITTQPCAYPVYTHLAVPADGVYYYNASVLDIVGFTNSTETRNITLDITLPSSVVLSPNNYTTAPTLNNVQAYYKLDNTTSTTYNIIDETGAANMLLQNYNNHWVAGKINGAYYFGMNSSANDNAATSAPTTIGKFGTGPFTIALWMNSTTSGDGALITHSEGSINTGGWWLDLFQGNLRFDVPFADLVCYPACSGSTSIFTNTWTRVVVTRDISGNISLYTNGVLRTSAVSSYDLSETAYLRMGSTVSNGWPFTGKLDEVILTNSSWNQSDVTADYNSGAGKQYQITTNIVISNQTYYNYTNQTFIVNVSDNLAGISNATLYINNVSNYTASYNNSGLLTSLVSVPVSLFDGVYNWFWRTYDWAGNIFTTNTYQTIIDTTYPQITFTTPTYPNGANVSSLIAPIAVIVNETNLANLNYTIWNATWLNSTSINSFVYQINGESEWATDYVNYGTWGFEGGMRITPTMNITLTGVRTGSSNTFSRVDIRGSTPNSPTIANSTFKTGNWFGNFSVNLTAGNSYWIMGSSDGVHSYSGIGAPAYGTNISGIIWDQGFNPTINGIQNLNNGYDVDDITFYTTSSNAGSSGILTKQIIFTVPYSGVYYYNVTATDVVGHINSTETRRIALDTIAPNATIVSPNNQTTYMPSIANNLALYYKLDDVAGNGIDTLGRYNLTVGDTVRGVPGIINNAYSFNGINSSVHNNNFAQVNRNFTVSAWAYQNDYSPTGQRVVGLDNGWEIDLEANQYSLRLYNSTTGLFYPLGTADPANNTGKWMHLVAVVNDTTITGYINGQLGNVSTITLTGAPVNMSEIEIGRYWGGGQFNGKIDEVGVWNRPLTASEISVLYNNGNPIQYPFQNIQNYTYYNSGNQTFILNATDNVALRTATLYITSNVVLGVNTTTTTIFVSNASNTIGDSFYRGIRFVPARSFALTNVTLMAGDTSSTCRITDDSNNILASSSVTSSISNFNYNMTAGIPYRIVCAGPTMAYSIPFTPITSSYGNITSQIYNGGIDNNGFRTVQSITIRETGTLYYTNTTSIDLGSAVQNLVSLPVALADGVYSWFWTVLDWAGNLFTTSTQQTIIDTTNPNLSISYPVNGGNYTSIQTTATGTIYDVNPANLSIIMAPYTYPTGVDCYQETADVATACGGLATGSYGTFIEGNGPAQGGFVFMNYSKPSGYLNATWQVKIGTGAAQNLTLPAICQNAYPDKLVLRLYGRAAGSLQSRAECFDGTTWQVLATRSGGGGSLGPGGPNLVYDGNWSTAACSGSGIWWAGAPDFNCGEGSMFEEAVIWRLASTVPAAQVFLANTTWYNTGYLSENPFLSGTSYTTASHGVPYVGTYNTQNTIKGLGFTVYQNYSLINITKDSSVSCPGTTTVRVSNVANGANILAQANFTGDVATLTTPLNLTAGSEYFLLIMNGANCVHAYSSTTALPVPGVGSMSTWRFTSSVNDGAYETNITERLYNFVSVQLKSPSNLPSNSWTGTIRNLASNQGYNNWTLVMTDVVNHISATTNTFFVDSILPVVSLVPPSDGNNSDVGRTYIVYNATASDTNLASVTVKLFNIAGSQIGGNRAGTVNGTLGNAYGNFSGLPTDDYYLYAFACDILNNCKNTSNLIHLDLSVPTINFTAPTPAANNLTTAYDYTSFPVNITTTDIYPENITIAVTGPGNYSQSLTEVTIHPGPRLTNQTWSWTAFSGNNSDGNLSTYASLNGTYTGVSLNRTAYSNYSLTHNDLTPPNAAINVVHSVYASNATMNQSNSDTHQFNINAACLSNVTKGLEIRYINEYFASGGECGGSCVEFEMECKNRATDQWVDVGMLHSFNMSAINYAELDVFEESILLSDDNIVYNNFTNMTVDGPYLVTGTIYDQVGNVGTVNRTVYITGNNPYNMSYQFPTPLGGGITLNYIPVNVSVIEPNIKNITIRLYGQNGSLYNSSASSSYVNNFYTRFYVPDGQYSFNATAYDIYDHIATLPSVPLFKEYGAGNTSICKDISFPGEYTVVQNLNKTTGVCLNVLTTGVTIDCQGHSITVGANGTAIASSSANTVLKNCKLYSSASGGTGFSLTGGSATVTNSTLDGFYGAYVNNAPLTISNSIITTNTYGIFVTGNGRVNANTLTFTSNTYAIYHNYTTVSPGGSSGSQVWGPSGAGTYSGLTFTGSGTDLINLVGSSYNTFTGLTSSNGADIRFTNSSNNKVTTCTLTGGTAVVLTNGSIANTFLDCKYDSESVDNSSVLIRSWSTTITTKDSDGNNVGHTTVHINDGSNSTVSTNDQGTVTTPVNQYINNGTITVFNPYEIFGVITDYGNSLFTDTQITTVNDQTQVDLTFGQRIRSTLLTNQVMKILLAIILLIGLAASTGFFVVKMRDGNSVADIWKYFIIMIIWDTIFLVLFLVLSSYVMGHFYPSS